MPNLLKAALPPLSSDVQGFGFEGTNTPTALEPVNPPEAHMIVFILISITLHEEMSLWPRSWNEAPGSIEL